MVKPGLEKLAGQTGIFTAKFERYSKTGRGHNTVLVKDVYDQKGIWICDHTWMHRTREMKNLNLERGDLLTFEAVVKKYYHKNKIVFRDDIHEDYGFERVKIMRVQPIIERPPKPERKPFKRWSARHDVE